MGERLSKKVKKINSCLQIITVGYEYLIRKVNINLIASTIKKKKNDVNILYNVLVQIIG